MKHFLLLVVLSFTFFLYADDYMKIPLDDKGDHVLIPYVELNESQRKRLSSDVDDDYYIFDMQATAVSLRTSMSPVRRQQYRLSCSAFAAIALFEYYNPNNDFSEQCLVKLSSNQDLGHTHQRINYALGNGLYSEKDCPYKTSTSARDTIPDLSRALITRPSGNFTYLDTDNASHIAHIRKSLRTGHPVAVSIFVAGEGWKKSGEILRAPTQEEINADCIKTNKGIKKCGAHAIVLTGYSQQPGVDYLEFKNSWGTSWGDKGYGKLSYGYYAKMRLAKVISKTT